MEFYREFIRSKASQGGKRIEAILKHSHVFAKSKDDLGRTSVVQHKIDTGIAIPVRQPPRRLPIARKGRKLNKANATEYH